MSQGIQPVRDVDVNRSLEGVLLPRLAQMLHGKQAGHCMRVGDLPAELMSSLCRRLREAAPDCEIHLLSETSQSNLCINAGKLIELRNPKEDGSLRPPLLVFVPAEIRAAAEDSFGVATFEDLDLADVFPEHERQLLSGMTNGMPAKVAEIIRTLRESGWAWVTDQAIARFLLAIKINGNTPDLIGAALCELGLVPDFHLCDPGVDYVKRLRRNLEAMEILIRSDKSERLRALDLGLANQEFAKGLSGFLAGRTLDNPTLLARKLAYDRGNWKFSFDKWDFAEDKDLDGICILVVDCNLPFVPEDTEEERLQHLVGHPYLPTGKKGLKRFSVSFTVRPSPGKLPALARFTAQIFSRDGGPTGLCKSRKAGKQAKATISFDKLSRTEWDEGWHYVRVEAFTADGDRLPLKDLNGNLLPWNIGQGENPEDALNHSELFYVVPDTDADQPVQQRATPRFESILHARFHFGMSSEQPGVIPDVNEIQWLNGGGKNIGIGLGMLNVKLRLLGSVNIPVSRALKVLEQTILREPDVLNWRLEIEDGIPGSPLPCGPSRPDIPEFEDFLKSRKLYFSAIRNGDSELITQAGDFLSLSEVTLDYATAYSSLLDALLLRTSSGSQEVQRAAISQLRSVLSLDSIRLIIRDHVNGTREAGLMSPTHPLRALWLATWAQLGLSWAKKLPASPPGCCASARTSLLEKIVPANVPPVLTINGGKQLIAVDNLNAFWTLYASPAEGDPRELVGAVCTAFSLPEPDIGGSLINGEYLAGKIKRYLGQHPYIQELIINAFGLGKGKVLAEAVSRLRRDSAFNDVRYNIRVFSSGTQGGEAIAQLSTGPRMDGFGIVNKRSVLSSFRHANLTINDFRKAPDTYAAHLSFLFDIFPPADVGAAQSSQQAERSAVSGLTQSFHTSYKDDGGQTARWERIPKHGPAHAIKGGEAFSSALPRLAQSIDAATAVVATGQTGRALRPVLSLSLQADDRSLIQQVHRVSDWVFTIDRNMGTEFYDHGGENGRPEYLIDHSPDMATSLGHRLVITSRSMTEIEAMLSPILQEYGLPCERKHAVAVLTQIRSLSGRLALKLLSAPTQRAEVLGLAFSRAYLDLHGAFSNQIAVPLDAHLELYAELKKAADDLGNVISFKRTDIALFDLDARARTITCRLVEVKCYRDVGNLGAFEELKNSIQGQLDESHNVLQEHFDHEFSYPDRPDRILKSHEFAILLRFYLERGIRHGVIDSEAATEFQFLLDSIEEGFQLIFTHTGIIFDFAKSGAESVELVNGIEFHRVGKDLIAELVNAAGEMLQNGSGNTAPDLAKSSSTVSGFSFTKAGAAAFLPVERDRATSDLVVGTPELQSQNAFTLYADKANTTSSKLKSEELLVAESAAVGTEKIETPVSAPGLAAELNDEGEIPKSTTSITSASDTPPEPPIKTEADAYLGVTSESPQYGILGEVSGRKVALDLNHTQTISLFGVQGGGKSYTLGTIIEMSLLQIPQINVLPKPMATVVFHYSPTQDYKPEFTSMVEANTEEREMQLLAQSYGAKPQALKDVVLLTPVDKLEERRAEFPNVKVVPLLFSAAELQASHWLFLMGAVGNQSAYIRQLKFGMRKLRKNGQFTVAGLEQEIEASSLSEPLKELARMRLNFAAQYIKEGASITALVKPGRLLIVDLRDEFIEKDEALGLFVVLMQLLSEAKDHDESFNKLVVFDEAHKYIENPDLVKGLVEVVREMRHKGTSILVASQDPPSVPTSLIELSSQIIMHKFNSPAWLKHLQKANASLGGLSPEKMAALGPGQAYVWSSKATDDSFTQQAIRIQCRPRVTLHGGNTKTAVEG
jgi:hypothetical protein